MIQIWENLRRKLSQISVLIQNAAAEIEEGGTNFREHEKSKKNLF